MKTHEWDDTRLIFNISKALGKFAFEKVDQDYKCIHCGIEKNKSEISDVCPVRVMKEALE